MILAGGLGSRLKPFTQIIPKPLLPIGEKSVLELQIGMLKRYGFDQIYLATNFRSEYIERFFGDGSHLGVSLKISREDEPLGTAGPLTLLREELDEPFLLMNGDILTLLPFDKIYHFATQMDAELTVGVKKFLMPFAFGNIFYQGDYVTGIEEKPDIETTILAGIYVFKPSLLEVIPDNTYFGMDTLIKYMLEKQQAVAKYSIEEYWLDIGRAEDYQKAQDDFEVHFRKAEGF